PRISLSLLQENNNSIASAETNILSFIQKNFAQKYYILSRCLSDPDSLKRTRNNIYICYRNTMIMNKSFAAALFFSAFLGAQSFTKQDSLKGSNTQYRNFWDVKHYDITVEPNFQNKSLTGTNR